MRLTRKDEQKKCSFCENTQQTARWLIASPNQRAYICDECTVESRVLNLDVQKPRDLADPPPDSSSRVNGFLRKIFHPEQLQCSFCRQRVEPPDVAATRSERGVSICRNCLTVCRQIVISEDETKRKNDASGLISRLLVRNPVINISNEVGLVKSV